MKNTTPSIWTTERIAEVKAKHGVDSVFLLRRHGADALGFRKDDIFVVAEGSLAGKRDKRYGGVYFKWRDTLDKLAWTDSGDVILDDEKFTSASCAAVVVSGAPADSHWWKRL